MKLNRTIVPALAALACLTSVHAATYAFDSTANDQSDAGSTYSNGIGHVFTVSTDITVKSLVFEGWSGNGNGTGTNGGLDDAGDDAVTMQLWNADTNSVLFTYTFSGDSEASTISYVHGVYQGVRHEHGIPDLVLTSGTEYIINAHTLSGIEYINNASTQTAGAEINHIQERWANTAGNEPTNNDGAAFKYGGPSFSYEVVPEPSSAALLGLGGLALLLRRKV